jgi:catechol 2,3-dioxygenase-like lactoylglutathione lyase family enzyme
MSRLQLALNVPDLQSAIEFYSQLFRTAPAKVRPGYANFAVADPPLKLVLIEGGDGNTINHLGVEVETTDEVSAAIEHFTQLGLPTDIEEQTTCCYAVQDKVWVSGPDATRWEVYTVLADAPTMSAESTECCAAPAATSVAIPSPVSLGRKAAEQSPSSCC